MPVRHVSPTTTVDEHTIRAIGLLSQIEARPAHRRSSARVAREFPRLASRRALYVAVLLHDIAKGRGGRSLGAGGRCGTPAVPAVSGWTRRKPIWSPGWWLQHLLMSRTGAETRPQPIPRRSRISSPEVQKPSKRLRNLAIPDRGGRYPRGRAGHLEQLERASSWANSTMPRRERPAAGPQGGMRANSGWRPKKDAVARAAGRTRTNLVDNIGAPAGGCLLDRRA